LRAVAAAAAALALLAAAGCGGDDEPSAEYRNCQAESENLARAEVLRMAFEDGRLGTQAEVEADFGPGGGKLFDAQGRMVPYDELEGVVKGEFAEWQATSEFPGRQIQLEMLAAERRVEDDGWPDCEDLE
jgi:hypothetical protein